MTREESSMQVKTMAASSSFLKPSCKYCKNSHDLAECDSAVKLPTQEKRNFVMRLGLCFGCLMRGHTAVSCPQRKTCEICKGRHPTALHRSDEEVVSFHSRSTLPHVQGCKLHIVPMLITWGTCTVKTNAFLDTGSTHSFCSRDLLKALGCNPEEATTISLQTAESQSRLPP